jgi:cyclopropane fatty-acyl-phospholipid synthase-like methyltransferase
MDSAKRYAPATLRNREPIREVLQEVLPQRGYVLEIGSGSGEHAVFFAASFPALTWQPTDADSECLASIAAWRAEAGLPNLRAPRHLDVCTPAWPAADDQVFDAVVNINMIHIAAWEVCQGLMAGAARVLRGEGILLLYGPFKVAGRHTAPSNAAFDASLKAMNPRFGTRDVAAVAAEAARHGLMLEKQVQMPANNFSLVFRRHVAARGVGS